MTPTRQPSMAAASVTLALAALCLAACASAKSNPARTAANVDMLYPLKVSPQADKIALALHAEGLSPAQTQALRQLALRRKETEGGEVVVSVPRGGADPVLAEQGLRAVRDALVADGVAVQDISSKPYDAADAKAPLVISYEALKAEVTACGKNWDDLTHTRDNEVYSTFGCSVNANMAAQIANPHDIVQARAEDPSSVDRRLSVLDKYSKAIDTSSTQDAAKSGIISKAIP